MLFESSLRLDAQGNIQKYIDDNNSIATNPAQKAIMKSPILL